VEEPIYLDSNASVAPLDEVVDAMLPWLRMYHANPHSSHFHGERAARAIEEAREFVGKMVGCAADEVIFTSGATESNNLAVLGLLCDAGASAFVYTASEHKSIHAIAAELMRRGTSVQCVGVDESGLLHSSVLEQALRHAKADRILVSAMHVNNELGSINDLESLAQVAHRLGAHFHTDASQSFRFTAFDAVAQGIDLATISSHKIGGPQGVGALYVSSRMRGLINPIMFGGGQQEGVRPGTMPTFLIVGFGVASRLAASEREVRRATVENLESAFTTRLRERGLSFRSLVPSDRRAPGELSLEICGIDAEDLVARLFGVLSVSTGSACQAGSIRVSQVLLEIGLPEDRAASVVRTTIDHRVTRDDIVRAAELLVDAARASESF
jgi:cysteine desulfurase